MFLLHLKIVTGGTFSEVVGSKSRGAVSADSVEIFFSKPPSAICGDTEVIFHTGVTFEIISLVRVL